MDDWPNFIKEHFNKNVPFIRFMGIEVLETAHGHARIRMPLAPEHGNSYGIGHGGVCAALVDTATGIALRTLRYKIVTVETNTVYYAPAMLNDVLYATGDLTRQGRKLLHAEAVVRNAAGQAIAGGKTIYFIIGEDNGVDHSL